jgi:leucyl/phenylalanyl-tRNA---protein transferase
MSYDNNLTGKDDFLKPDNMIRLYATGAFPMADEITGKIDWFLPEIRTIIPINNYNIPRSLKKYLSGQKFEIKYDCSFLPIVKGCQNRETTWISEELIEAYQRLEKKGFVHTVETWKDGELVGGLYGIAYRGSFFGESMFSSVPQASKAALAALLEHLHQQEFILLDVQYMTPHLKMFGAVEITFAEYNKLLYKSYLKDCKF